MVEQQGNIKALKLLRNMPKKPRKKLKKASIKDVWHSTTLVPVLEITKTQEDRTSVTIKRIDFYA